jgi:hypothetical protein
MLLFNIEYIAVASDDVATQAYNNENSTRKN